MCGITGAFSNTRVAEGLVEAATRAITHRGPDDSGIQRIRFALGEAVLGNCRLAILDLSAAGHMPMSDPATGSWVTYNGEIYNFRELKQQLAAAGDIFASDTDTEVILKGFLRHGAPWFARLRGMFACAIYDGRDQSLVLARDRFGIKPLYYTQKDGAIVFASEVRALLKCGAAPKQLDPVAVYQYLAFGSVYEPQTIVKDVKSLPAGCFLKVSQGTMKAESFADIAAAFSKHSADDAATATKRVGELVQDSIRKHIVSDVPVSLFLSGGIDSTVIAMGLRQIGVEKLHSFSVVFDEADYTEAALAKEVADRAGTVHHEVQLTGDEVLAEIPRMLAALDQPSFDGVNSFVISRAVRNAGFKVALSGLGGDEMFGGYSTFTSVPQLREWQSKTKKFPRVLQPLISMAAGTFAKSADQKRKLRELLAAPFPHPYGVMRGMFMPETIAQLMSRHEEEVAYAAVDPLVRTAAESNTFDPGNQVSYLELANYMRNTLLRDVDAMSMANSLEVRVPFVDHELLEYVASLSGEVKFKAGSTKSLLTSAFADVLPAEILSRPKQGFMLPFDHWLRDEMKNSLESAMNGVGSEALREFIDPKAVAGVWQSFLAGETSWTRPWSLFTLQKWCEHNLDATA